MENNSKKRIAIYIRIGAGSQISESVEWQANYYKDLVSKRPDCVITKIYADVGTSGKSKNRYSYKDMIADAEKGEFDYIVVKSMSRFNRDMGDAVQTLQRLKKNGVGVYLCDEGIDTFSDKYKTVFAILNDITETENRLKAERRQLKKLLTKQ